MKIETNPAYTSPLYTRAPHTAENTDTGQTSTPASSRSTEANTAVTAKTNAVTGTTGSRLSAETTAELIQSTQQDSTTAPKADRTIYDVQKDVLDELINDPKKAKEYAERFKNVMLIPGNGLQLPANGSSAEVLQKFKIEQASHMSKLNNLAQERTKLFDKLKSEGKSDIEIIVKMFDFEANAPSRHGPDAIGYAQPQSVFNNRSYSQFSGEMRDYLSQQIKEKLS